MEPKPKPVDIDGFPALVDLARSVRDSGEARELCAGGETVAVLVPPRARHRAGNRRTRDTVDHEALLASFGAWKGLVDPDELKRRLRGERGSDRSMRPLP